MADDFGLALQKALITRLKADADIIALVGGRVYDEPPQNATFPLLRLGELNVSALRASCVRAATVTFGIEAESRPTSGRVEATRCAEAVVAALDGYALSVTGFSTVSLLWRGTTVDRDGDGESYTAIAAFTAVLDG